MATRSGQQYQRPSTSLPDLIIKEEETQIVKRKAGNRMSVRSLSRKGSIIASTKSKKDKLEEQLAVQKVELEFKEKELQLRMEQLEIQKEVAITKALLEVVDETSEDELLIEDDDLKDVPAEEPDEGVRRFLNTLPPAVNQNVSPNNSSETNPMLIKQLVDSFKLPPLRVASFNGDPLKYPMWETSFNSLIADKVLLAGEKLNLLSQYLVGEPYDMVSSYMLLQDEGAYQLARKELKSRYGNNSEISRAFLTKLYDWPKIGAKDASRLRNFSDFLNEVCAAKKRIPDLGLLDYKQENYKIISKLPTYIENKWRRIVQEHLEEDGFPSFEVFCKFIEQRSKEANIPIFDCSSTPTSNSQPNRSSKKSFAMIEMPTCALCKGKHQSVKCDRFCSSTSERKIELLKDWKLCFGCLKYGHRSKECRNRMKCET
ncbi:uncharacterized protein LOC117106510, partial [Anneissia japonica]|uniref:uncharacterized protein LOC117106510 n=1 Tax=Anneissia japonica TaxID=1529436 RepID=UPI001425561A